MIHRQQLRAVLILATALVLLSLPAQAQSPLDGFNPGADDAVIAIVRQPDGKIVVAGSFLGLGGGTGATPRNHIGRINRDGSIDLSFDPDVNSDVNALALQPDGQIVLGGVFTSVGGQPRNRLARINADGSIDLTFDPNVNGPVRVIAVEPDGQIVIAGEFTSVGGEAHNRIARLNADGSLDTSFNPSANSTVRALVVQPNGAIVVAGLFTTLDGGATSRQFIGRLNPDGSLDGFNPGANAPVNALAQHADGRIVAGGDFTLIGGGGTGTTPRDRLARLAVDGSVDPSFNPGANTGVLALTIQPDGKILVSGSFSILASTPRNKFGRLNFDGSIDPTFDPNVDGNVLAMVPQPDGQLTIVGNFVSVGGTTRNAIARLNLDTSLETDFDPLLDTEVSAAAIQPDGKIVVGGCPCVPNESLARLNADGTIDPTFDSGADDVVLAVTVQRDGKILVGGFFTTLGPIEGTTSREFIGRLNSDGSVDPDFNPGADGPVNALVIQPDGKILVGGSFGTLAGALRSNIGRLNPDGSIDPDFDPGVDGEVVTIAVQSDGQILIGGQFSQMGGGGAGQTPRSSIGRVDAAGTLDTTFDPGADSECGCSRVDSIVVQPDDRILVAGAFEFLGDGATMPRLNIGRLHFDGSPDLFFDPGADDEVATIALQTDGKILLGGFFTTLGGGVGVTTRNFLGRVDANGFVDPTFDPGANLPVIGLNQQVDGKVLVNGFFFGLGGGDGSEAERDGFGRLTNTAATAQNLTVPDFGHTIAWVRSGPAPDVSHVTVESSLDAVNYTPLGNASRAGGTWVLDEQSLPVNQNVFIRTRADYFASQFAGNGSIFESVRNVYIGCPVVGPTTIASAIAGQPYSVQFTSTGALGIVTFGQDNPAPNGMTFTPDGLFSGTPLETGTFPLLVTATDSSSGCTGSVSVTLVVACPTITLSTTTFPGGTAGVAYPATTVTQTGGIGGATFTITSGALPAGMAISSAGVVSGTPTATGTFNFTVTATDANGCTGSRAYSVTIACPTITLSATTFPNGTAGVAYPATTVTQTGGIGATTFAVTSGALPAGMTLSSGGVVSGTPTVTGTFNFTITATDSNGCTGVRAYSVTITCPTITVLPPTLPNATIGVPYPATLITQAGGVGAVTFAITSGGLPPGLTLTSAGILSGTPTAAGTVDFTITATDANGCIGSRTYQLNVACPTTGLSLAGGFLPQPRTAVPYQTTIPSTGAAGAVTFTLIGGVLPTGFTLASNGSITGTAAVPLHADLGVRARDAAGCSAIASYVLNVAAPRWLSVGSDAGQPGQVISLDETSTMLAGPLGSIVPGPSQNGVRVALGDVHGDGRIDVITGAGPGDPPIVTVFNGAIGALDRSFFAFEPEFLGGVFVAAGDVNGDGRAEIIVGAGPGHTPIVRVFDAVSLAPLPQPIGSFMAYAPAFTGGVTVAAGDVNGDGRADIITGAGPGGAPQVRVLDARTATELANFFSFVPSFAGGVFVAAGDVNGDGFADVITGAGAGGGPHVVVWDIHNGNAPIRSFFAYTPLFPGGVRVAAADFDGDGKTEIITGAGPGGGPHVQVFDGADLHLRQSFMAFGTFIGGVFVAGPAPLNRMAIDSVRPSVITPGALRVDGWALSERNLANRTGVQAIHVWAYPASGGTPQFVGSTALGDPRTDVASFFGGEFYSSGFHLETIALAPGTYDFIVYAIAQGTLAPINERTVRVVVP